jgi:hypothetical protein
MYISVSFLSTCLIHKNITWRRQGGNAKLVKEKAYS